MLILEQTLAARLKQLRVHMDVPDGNTVFFRNVPANDRFFNKSHTNLLVKQPQPGLPFLVCVDENLEYTGTDRVLTRAFASGQKRQGWRVLFLEPERQSDFEHAVRSALRVLGFDGVEPELNLLAPGTRPAPQGGVLASFGTDLSATARDPAAEPTVGRAEAIDEVLSYLLQWQARLPVVVGRPGVGKTNLPQAIARKLVEYRPALRVLSLDLGTLMSGTLFDAERENLLAALLHEATAAPGTIVALEHLELTLCEAPHGPLLLGRALERGVRLIGTTLPEFLPRFDCAPFASRLHMVELNELDPSDTCYVLLALRDRIAKHHQLGIDDAVVRAAVERSQSLEGYFPAKAIGLLDAAAASAALAGASHLSLYDIYLSATHFRETTE